MCKRQGWQLCCGPAWECKGFLTVGHCDPPLLTVGMEHALCSDAAVQAAAVLHAVAPGGGAVGAALLMVHLGTKGYGPQLHGLILAAVAGVAQGQGRFCHLQSCQ